MDNEKSLVNAEIVESTAIEQITRGEVDMQVATAKRYPRSIEEFNKQALGMAIRTSDIARSCFYVIPRAGKMIEGPSVRLAEIVATSWGNLRCETRVVSVSEKTVTAQATVWDMQRNVLIRCETSRRITDKYGKRYSDDMVLVTGNAAASVALRNAVFRVVPMSYIENIYSECKRVAANEQGGIDVAKERWFVYFEKLGIKPARVLEMLGKKGLADVDLEDISTLQGLCTALKDGETTIELIFGNEPMRAGINGFGFKAKEKETVSEPTQNPEKEQKQAKKSAPAKSKKQEQEQDETPPPPSDDDVPWDKYTR